MSEPPATPPPDQPPPRPAFRRYYSLPTWFFSSTPEEREDPAFEERLKAWFREQRLAREARERAQNAKPENDAGPPG